MLKKWEDEDLKKFIELYPTVPTDDLCVIFDRTKSSLVTKAYRVGVKKIIREDGLRYVYPEEEERIIEYSKFHSIPEICQYFDRDYAVISKILKNNNCFVVPSEYWWTEEEEKYLIENFYEKSPKDISIFLNRKWRTITKKARQMGLKRKRNDGEYRLSPRNLTDEDKNFIINNHEIMTSSEMAKNINIAIDVVLRFCEKNNISVIRSRKDPQNYSDEELLNMLKEKGDFLGRCPTTEEVQKDMLFPSIDIYYDRFDSFKNACEIVGFIPNGGQYGTICYSKNNDLCYSIQEQIITNFFIDNSIEYIKEYEYKNIISNLDIGIVMDWYICNSIVVEFFGLENKKTYDIKTKLKQNICLKNNVRIISIFPRDIKNIINIFSEFINKNP